MTVGSDSTTADPPEEFVSAVSDAEVPIIPADQARDELGPLIDAVQWDSDRMAEVERLLKGYADADREGSSGG